MIWDSVTTITGVPGSGGGLVPGVPGSGGLVPGVPGSGGLVAGSGSPLNCLLSLSLLLVLDDLCFVESPGTVLGSLEFIEVLLDCCFVFLMPPPLSSVDSTCPLDWAGFSTASDVSLALPGPRACSFQFLQHEIAYYVQNTHNLNALIQI